MGCVSEKALCLQYIHIYIHSTIAPSGAGVRACVLSAVTLHISSDITRGRDIHQRIYIKKTAVSLRVPGEIKRS